MAATSKGFRYPVSSDTPDIPRDFENLANDLDDYFTNNGITINGSLKKFGDSVTIDSLPAQTGNTGKYLTTDGSSASWAVVDSLPSQTGNSGKYLTTDGSVASWATVSGGGSSQSTQTTLGSVYGWFDTDMYMPSLSTSIGYNALATSTGFNNTAMGFGALYTSGGSGNSAFGANAQTYATGASNSGFGASSLSSVTGYSNSALGSAALISLAGGSYNIGIGASSGSTLTTGDNNIIIGYNADVSADLVSNEITLGNSSITTLRCQVTSITSLSDSRDKKNIEPLNIGIDFVNKLNPVKFDWNMRDGGKIDESDTGFIAQDLVEIEDATGIADYLKLTYRNNPDKLEASYGRLIPVLVKAIQDLSAEVEQLKSKVG